MRPSTCYLMTMRFLTLLIMFALTFTNGAAVAAAMCQHRDARTHVLARASADQRVSAEAITEDHAAAATSGKASLGDAAATWLAGYALPAEPTPFPLMLVDAMHRVVSDDPALAGISVPPLLEPPVA